MAGDYLDGITAPETSPDSDSDLEQLHRTLLSLCTWAIRFKDFKTPGIYRSLFSSDELGQGP